MKDLVADLNHLGARLDWLVADVADRIAHELSDGSTAAVPSAATARIERASCITGSIVATARVKCSIVASCNCSKQRGVVVVNVALCAITIVRSRNATIAVLARFHGFSN